MLRSRSILDTDQLRRVKVSQFAVIFALGLSVMWFGYFSLSGDQIRTLLMLLVTSNGCISLGLFWLGHDFAARVYWLVSQTSLAALACVYFGPESDIDLTFMAMLGMPFLVFSWRREPVTLVLSLLLVITLSCLAFGSAKLGLDYLSPFGVIPRPAFAEMISVCIKISVASLVAAQIGYYDWISRKASLQAEAAQHAAEEALKAKGAFLAQMSHEIRTPMNGIVGMVEVLGATDLCARQNRIVQTVQGSAFSLLRIIDDILDTSKIEAGKMEIRASRTDLHVMIEEIARSLQSTADAKDVDIRLRIDPLLPEWVLADSGRLRQILLNLLSNAIKYSAQDLTDKRGQVLFRIEPGKTGTIRFLIRDNGVGMSDSFQQSLFEPFSHDNAERQLHVGGTGLGLTITRNLLDLMSGTIQITSEAGVGTCVDVTVPVERLDGPSRVPDLRGVDIVVFDLLDRNAREAVRLTISHTHGRVHFATCIDDLAKLSPSLPERPIILMPTPHVERAELLISATHALLPEARIVRFTKNRLARLGMEGDKCYWVQMHPLLPSELQAAIATLANKPGHKDLDTLPPPIDASAGRPGIAKPQIEDAKQCTVLVVEDNEINRIVLSNQLDILGYPHDLAPDGIEGLRKWRTGQYDLILTDCHMPKMDGFELTAAIRKEEGNRQSTHTPIIAITANALEGDAQKCLLAGMDGYLAKPIEINELRESLESRSTLRANFAD